MHVVLIGHSMGGILAADTVLGITGDELTESSRANNIQQYNDKVNESDSTSSLLFPHIQALLTFDTPFLGINPALVAHGAQQHWDTASKTYKTAINVASAFGWGGAKAATQQGQNEKSKDKQQPLALPAPPSSPASDPSPTSQKTNYGRMALFAGAASAALATGAAAYWQRERIGDGYNWMSQHLQFVGCLARPEDLKQRWRKIGDAGEAKDVGRGAFFTVLGSSTGSQDRTFVNLPVEERGNRALGLTTSSDAAAMSAPSKEEPQHARDAALDSPLPKVMALWPAVNDMASTEVDAHCAMFQPRRNPGYFDLCERSRDSIVGWVKRAAWFHEAEQSAATAG